MTHPANENNGPTPQELQDAERNLVHFAGGAYTPAALPTEPEEPEPPPEAA